MTDINNLNDDNKTVKPIKKSDADSNFFEEEVKKLDNSKVKSDGLKDDGKKSTNTIKDKNLDNKVNYMFSESKDDGDNFLSDSKTTKSGGINKNNNSFGGGGQANNDKGSTKAKKRDGGDVGVWIVTIIILAAFVFLILWASNSGTTDLTGSITGEEIVRYGAQNELNLNIENHYAAEDKQIVWYVDGTEVKRVNYGEENALSLGLKEAGLTVGEHTVTAKIDDQEVAVFTVKVEKPLLKVVAPTLEICYGDSLPILSAEATGWVDGDTAESVKFDGLIVTNDIAMPSVGEYPLRHGGFTSDKYDVEVLPGSLKVLPRELTFAPCRFSKVYDGTTAVDSSNVSLMGIIGNDLVGANVVAEFADKHAGDDKKVNLISCELVGDSKDNYTINCQNAEFTGSITPLNVKVKGIVANDKVFDGTTTVTFASSGELVGVLTNDKVNIGELLARFSDNKRGQNKTVIIEKITLMGEDCKNYVATCDNTTANIVGKHTGYVPSN